MDAIEKLRAAPDEPAEAKAKLVDGLGQTAAKDARVQRARDECVAAYRLTAAAAAEDAAIQKALEGEAAPTPALADKLLAAQAQAKKARSLREDCDGDLASLKMPVP